MLVVDVRDQRFVVAVCVGMQGDELAAVDGPVSGRVGLFSVQGRVSVFVICLRHAVPLSFE
jgi:hypothetical protein